jgi:serine/threonine protein kinase
VKDFELGEELGRGAMGVVYRARQTSLGRDVALKVVAQRAVQMVGAGELLKRFEREIRALIAVAHPNVVRVIDTGIESNGPWIAMELVDGVPLSTVLEDAGALPPAHALHVTRQLADALAACHAAGLVHRDVKPGNAMLDRAGRVTLMDFGLAKDKEWTELTRTGAFLGTPRYAAPESFETSAVTPAADVYSLGIVLFEMLSGENAYGAMNMNNVLAKVIQGPRVLASVRPDLPAAVCELVAAMTSRSPAARPTARDVVAAIDSGLLLSTPIRPRSAIDQSAPTLASSPPVKPRRRSARTVVACVLACCGAVALAALGFRSSVRPLPAPSPVASPARTPAPASVPSPRTGGTYPPIFGRWREHAHELAALRGPEPAAKEAAARIARSIPMDLGRSIEPWAHWIELGRWLAGDGPRSRPPRYRRAAPGPMDSVNFALTQSDRRDFARVFGPRLVSLVLREVGQWPMEGRVWALLGLVLELEGAHDEARQAYRWCVRNLPALAPAHDGGDGLGGATELQWQALARALGSNPEIDFASAWWAHEPTILDPAWDGLARALHDRQGTHDAVLARAPAGADRNALLPRRRGHWLARHEDPESALRTWIGAAEAKVADGYTCGTVIHHLVDRGRLEEARSFADRHASWAEQELLAALEFPDRCPVPAAETAKRLNTRRRRSIELNRLIAAGRLDEAEEFGRWRPFDPGTSWQFDFAALPLVGAGSRAPEWSRVITSLLADGPYDLDAWYEAAGALATEKGSAAFETATQAAEARWPENAVPHLARALWASRQDRHGEALDALDRARAHDRTKLLPAHAVLEVLARASLMDDLGRRVDAATLRRVLSDPGPSDPSAAAVWTALRERKLPAACELARRAQDCAPHEHVWTFVSLACARIVGPDERYRQWERQALHAARASIFPLWRMRMLRAIGAGS